MAVNDGRPIQAVMQSFFEGAMRGAGYQIVPSNPSATIVEGDVYEWWVDSCWNYVVRVGVLVRVRDRAQGTILYQREIRGEEDDMI
ncbi:MAG TPA: hypothetical protein PLU30_10705 [Verrucomicrobiae bacterium]|nr:hypothetical protein [Verrucomicrobiae bacterium]